MRQWCSKSCFMNFFTRMLGNELEGPLSGETADDRFLIGDGMFRSQADEFRLPLQATRGFLCPVINAIDASLLPAKPIHQSYGF